MIKIVYLVSTLERTGPTNQLFNIIKYLDQSNYEVHLVTLSSEPVSSRWNDFKSLGVCMHSIQLSRIVGILLGKKKVEEIINKIKPHIVHSHGVRSDIILSRLHFKGVRLSTIHNYPQHDYIMKYGKLKGQTVLKCHMAALREFDCLIGCSKSVSENIIKNYDFDNVVSIQNGVDLKGYPFRHNRNTTIMKRLELHEHDVIWISTGSLITRKDPIFLIERWYDIERKYPNHHLVFLGSGPLEDKCLSLTRDIKNVHFLGEVSNVSEYLGGSDFFVSASKAEGLPMAVIEALATGLPVLLTNIKPHKEIFDNAIPPGDLFEQDDIESFYKSFKRVISSDYVKLNKNASGLARSKFDAQEMSRQYQQIYSSSACKN